MMQATTAVNPPIVENLPPELTERPQWVCWRLEERGGIQTKVPYIPGTERKASSTDLMTWRTFSEALAAYEAGEPPYDGVGFVFCSGDRFAGIDLDSCRDPETGAVEQWAKEIIDDAAEGYVEVSPSGTGIHIIVEGRVRGGGIRRGPVEMYSAGRFFALTGVLL
jgi:putative DNA primase/helicase